MNVGTLRTLTVFLLLVVQDIADAQIQVWPDEQNRWRNQLWQASWITHPEVSGRDYGVFLFRKEFELDQSAEHFILHISADNRYRLFVNGHMALEGPARSDPHHWVYESVDIAPLLMPGSNVLAVMVWNMGEYLPHAQMSVRTGLIVQGDGSAEARINTDRTWMVWHDQAYAPIRQTGTGTVVGPGDSFDGTLHPFGWEQVGFNATDWRAAAVTGRGIPVGMFGSWDWQLTPRQIPFLQYDTVRFAKVVRAENIDLPSGMADRLHWKIPSNTQCRILLDNQVLTNAYPRMTIKGGEGTTIQLEYAEALFDADGIKGNRDQIEGKVIAQAFTDRWKVAGGDERVYTTLWFRTYRYVQLTIQTGDDPVEIVDFEGIFRGYPFVAQAKIETDDPQLSQIWETGWRTARLCAGETYYDCPYYEQLQYIGDTRIQALISLYVSGDERLMRNAITQFARAQLSNGLTQSRFPSSRMQIIPTFSLVWVAMVYDYWMHREDDAFIRQLIPQVRQVLEWYARQLNDRGLLDDMPWWNFVDWSFGEWSPDQPVGGVPVNGFKGETALITLQYAYTLRLASELFGFYGETYDAGNYRLRATQICAAVKRLCWDDGRQLLRDAPEHAVFSQHTQLFAILCDMFPDEEAVQLFDRMTAAQDIIPCTYYFRFYMNRVMDKLGLGEQYLESLDEWKQMLANGLTTFAETPEPTRSDCHAWSASPNYDLLALVAGIKPREPGFKSILIEPNPGRLKQVKAAVPHPRGIIFIHLRSVRDNAYQITVGLPDRVTAELRFGGKSYLLGGGEHSLMVKRGSR